MLLNFDTRYQSKGFVKFNAIGVDRMYEDMTNLLTIHKEEHKQVHLIFFTPMPPTFFILIQEIRAAISWKLYLKAKWLPTSESSVIVKFYGTRDKRAASEDSH